MSTSCGRSTRLESDGADGTASVPGPGDFVVRRGESTHSAAEVVAHARRLLDAAPYDAEPLPPRECALLLRGLGFEVTGGELPPLRFTSAATVGAEHARATWALAARERLLEVAGTYGEVIDHRDLADFVQRRSLVRGSATSSGWVGDVLGRVAQECHRRREPLLTSLVVDARGRVGASYATALLTLRGEEPDDVDDQAAHERLDCHRHFGAALPEGGGAPVQLVRRAEPRPKASAREPRRRAAAGARPRAAAPPRSTTGTRRSAEESVAAAPARDRGDLPGPLHGHPAQRSVRLLRVRPVQAHHARMPAAKETARASGSLTSSTGG